MPLANNYKGDNNISMIETVNENANVKTRDFSVDEGKATSKLALLNNVTPVVS